MKTAQEVAEAGVRAGCEFDKNSRGAGATSTRSKLKDGADMALIEVKVPDIGDFKDVAVIEVLVKPGDAVKAEQSLITVESDKASMEIPSSHAGVVKELKVKLGDKVKRGFGAAGAGGGRGGCSLRPLPPRRPSCGGEGGLASRRALAAALLAGSYAGGARRSSATCSCSAPARAATRPRSARPTSA